MFMRNLSFSIRLGYIKTDTAGIIKLLDETGRTLWGFYKSLEDRKGRS
jgi:hypothetical protein